jgi:uncharacterized protein (UPF0303 family)
MSNTSHTSAADLLAEEQTLRLGQVDETVTYRIGSHIAERALQDVRSVMVTVFLGDWLVYKAALPGTSINNDIVIEGKKRVAIMDGHSSLWARNRHLDAGTTFEAATGLPLPGHAPYGGAVPLVTVDGDQRGWVIVSGLTQEEDHEFAVAGIRAAQSAQSARRGLRADKTYLR